MTDPEARLIFDVENFRLITTKSKFVDSISLSGKPLRLPVNPNITRYSNCKFIEAHFLKDSEEGHPFIFSAKIFQNCNMTGFRVTDPDTIFTGVLFKNCEQDNADFNGANIEGAEFKHCRLRNVDFTEVKGIHNRTFTEGCILAGAMFTREQWKETGLSEDNNPGVNIKEEDGTITIIGSEAVGWGKRERRRTLPSRGRGDS